MSKLLSFIQAVFEPHAADSFFQFWAKELLDALLILGFFWLLTELASRVLNKWGRSLAAMTKSELVDSILIRAIPYITRMLLVLGGYLAIRSMPIHEKAIVFISGVLYIILVVIVCNLLYHAMEEFMKWYLAGRQDDRKAALSSHIQPMAEKVFMLFLMGTGLIIILKHFNYDIFSLVTALGIGSLAIGMAAKDTLAHMISGFTLMLDRPFEIGDRVKLNNGQVGDVMDIGLRSTKIRGVDATLMIIPNSDLCNSTVINMVRPNSLTQGRVSLGVGYASDMDQVKGLLLAIARDNESVVADPAPDVLFTSFGDSALNLLFLFWVDDPTRVGPVTDQLNCSILRSFRENGIEIPFPVRTVRLERQA